MSDDVFECRIWGKSEGLPPGVSHYPLLCHLIDTAVMADVLWDVYLNRAQRRLIAAGLGVGEDEARRVVALWAGLHDIGKAIPGWQAYRADLAEALHGGGFPGVPAVDAEAVGRHEAASQLLGPSLLAGLGWPVTGGARDGLPGVVAGQILGGHHGRFREPTVPGAVADPVPFWPGLGVGRWQSEREAVARVLAEITGAPPLGALDGRATVPAAAITVVTGLIVLADWLVSQEHHLARRARRVPAVLDSAAAHAWAKASRQQARSLVEEAGLEVPVLTGSAVSFTDMFGYIPITTPNLLQQSIATYLPGMLADAAGLTLVTAPTGDGKTEAALYAASLMGCAAGTHGIYLALPTQATTDQIHGRLVDWATANLPSAVTRLHGSSWMHQPDGEAEPRVIHGDTGQSVEATRWLLQSNRHGLLAHLAAGTIDQALLGMLPLKYGQLRHLGLSGKTLIIDEAHSYDAFTHALLLRLLEWCGAWQVPVVVLSATLTGDTAAGLVNAYRSGAGHTRPAKIEPAYPGWSFTDATTGQTCTPPVPVGTSRGRNLHIRLAPTRLGAPREQAIIRELGQLAEHGGCAAVICTTVAQAQATYRALAAAGTSTELHLLHARLPAHQRAANTQAAEIAFGRVNKPTTHRPARGVIVATQVIEQSLDLDFDLIISDLAPLALLLQRAGRAFRHGPEVWAAAGLTRPAWAGTEPRMTVLSPLTAQGAADFHPGPWGDVYPESLLHRTHEILDQHTGPINIPGDVQRLVNAVYDPVFASRTPDALFNADRNRIADDAARAAIARLVLVPAPGRTRTANLHRLTDSNADPDLITTRLGADSVHLVPTFTSKTGQPFLDPENTVELPLTGDTTDGRFSRAQVRQIMNYAVPMRAGAWLTQLTPDQQPPTTWAREPRLKRLVLLPHHPTPSGYEAPPIGGRHLHLHPVLGIVEAR
ncbi:CRISPR-associated helicase Cas3' [Streptomyces sannanensis]|uniref:CRISPR-associated helicase Cas3' n=1 Tax=Streptomyces sannanensis TaxID=285536 RepID=UPI0031ED04FB